MRKSNLAVGMVLALAASVALTGIAQGAVTGQRLTVTAAPSKKDKKVPSATGIGVTIDTFEAPPTDPSQTAAETVVRFDPDFTLGRTNNLGRCNPSFLANTSTEQARTLCGPTQVGSGNSTVCSALGGCGAASLPGVVTAFNGVPSGGSPAIILHNRIGPPANVTTILNGVLTGDVLTVQVPDTAATGLHLTHFFTSVPIKATGNPKKAAKKCKKIKSKPKRSKCHKKAKRKKANAFYISAKCSDRVWNFTETTTFRAGAPTQSASTTVPCQQKKKKKK